jgi:hypothetical protein
VLRLLPPPHLPQGQGPRRLLSQQLLALFLFLERGMHLYLHRQQQPRIPQLHH